MDRHDRGDPPDQAVYGGTVAARSEPDSLLLPGHDVPLGRYTTARRLLPQRQRRMVGAWCFVDHFGPDDVRDRPGMQIPPHPHTGLQTVTWLADGEILHRDSLGSAQAIAPGQLNLMTSGHGIAHSEHVRCGRGRRGAAGPGLAAVPRAGARRGRVRHRRAEPAVPARRGAVRRAAGHVVELRRPLPRGGRRARDDWTSGRRFGAVAGCAADPLPAPEMPTVRLKARDRHGRTLD